MEARGNARKFAATRMVESSHPQTERLKPSLRILSGEMHKNCKFNLKAETRRHRFGVKGHEKASQKQRIIEQKTVNYRIIGSDCRATC